DPFGHRPRLRAHRERGRIPVECALLEAYVPFADAAKGQAPVGVGKAPLRGVAQQGGFRREFAPPPAAADRTHLSGHGQCSRHKNSMLPSSETTSGDMSTLPILPNTFQSWTLRCDAQTSSSSPIARPQQSMISFSSIESCSDFTLA